MTDLKKEIEEEIKKVQMELNIIQADPSLHGQIRVGSKLEVLKAKLEGYNLANQETLNLLDDEIKWLNELLKLVLWHNERSLLPYDWFEYEHPRLLERLSQLQSKKKDREKKL